jgi:hypothetical protein
MINIAETSSPTISTSAIFIIAQEAATKGHTVATVDIGSAYLNATMPKQDPTKLVFMRHSGHRYALPMSTACAMINIAEVEIVGDDVSAIFIIAQEDPQWT